MRPQLGSDAVHTAEQNNIARLETDRKWRELSISSDFEAGGGSKVYPWERELIDCLAIYQVKNLSPEC
ncbi:hypothetical protein [Scytonema sp. PRP1]|uniref:hypothetical protein n=1 Tax=Scytonema sp. PRP1 TaxID=3120513 RepID=UPI002FD45768